MVKKWPFFLTKLFLNEFLTDDKSLSLVMKFFLRFKSLSSNPDYVGKKPSTYKQYTNLDFILGLL